MLNMSLNKDYKKNRLKLYLFSVASFNKIMALSLLNYRNLNYNIGRSNINKNIKNLKK
jgi:hypothetical protein